MSRPTQTKASDKPLNQNPNQTSANKNSLWKKVIEMSHLEVRRSVAEALEEGSKNVDGRVIELTDLRDFWQENVKENKLTDTQFKRSVQETVKEIHTYFLQRGLDIQGLRSDSPFISHINGFSKDNPVGCSQVMRDFCNYVCLASLSPDEELEACFVSFPPEQNFLNCLDGSKERIETSHLHLLGSKADYVLLWKAHQGVMDEFRNALDNHVPDGNMVHITSLIERSLGVRKEGVPHAESQIPASILWKMHLQYASKLKEKLLKLASEVNIIVKSIDETYPKCDLHKIRYDFSQEVESEGYEEFKGELSEGIEDKKVKNLGCGDVVKSINLRLKEHEIDEKSFVMEVDDSSCGLNQDLIDQACDNLYLPILSHLETVLHNDEEFYRSRIKTFSTLCRLGIDEELYSIENIQSIFILLNKNLLAESEDQVCYEDFNMAFEALSIMGSQCAGNSKAIFIGICKELKVSFDAKFKTDLEDENAPGCVDKIKAYLSKCSFHNLDKINLIEEAIKAYENKTFTLHEILDDENHQYSCQLGELFCDNYPSEDILRYIENRPIAELIKELGSEEGSYLSDSDNLDEACKSLMARPDRLQILRLLSDKIKQLPFVANQGENFEELPLEFSLGILDAAAKVNDVNSCEFVFNNFEISKEIFEDKTLMSTAATKRYGNLIKLFIQAHKKFYPDNGERLQELYNCVSESEIPGMDPSPIFVAAYYGNESFINAIVGEGIDMASLEQANIRDGSHMVHYAAENRKINFIELLARYGIDLSVKDKNGFQVSHYAAKLGYADVICALENGIGTITEKFTSSSSRGTPIQIAMMHGKKEVILELGRILRGKDIVNEPDASGMSLIHYAADRGFANVIPALCSIGANVNLKNEGGTGSTALILASQRGYPSIVEELIESGASLHEANKEGHDAIKYVIDRRDKGLMRSFLFTKNKDGNSALHLAALSENDTSRLINSFGLEPDGYHELNNAEESPLILVSERERIDLIKAMQSTGLDLNKRDLRGRSPIFMLSYLGIGHAIPILRELGADIDHQDENGDTALHIAVREGNKVAIQGLLKYGADQFIENKKGINSRDEASSQYDKKVIGSFIKMHASSIKNAIFSKDIDSVEKLLGISKEVELQKLLALSVQTSDAKIVKALVEAGADPTHKSIPFDRINVDHQKEILSYLENLTLDNQDHAKIDEENVKESKNSSINPFDDEQLPDQESEDCEEKRKITMQDLIDFLPPTEVSGNSDVEKVTNDNKESKELI